ncbi:CvpA family protein [Stenotrophomonas sp. CFBP8980]|uniref:CvpA family protein n=1 Tax=Stenotrophomonas sp. CFBP8980 TaxID=3096523 RepID=UPI002A69ED70|nr:CvpA family protein [Stenotrophomonas sp. CFBP8980]MDY1033324.1 CvpA family protein [Stenotrophomonas sp. CFBP8980]
MIDIVLACVIAISTLLGFVRGFVGIVVGTLSWLLAGWAAFLFGNDVAHLWSAPAQPGNGHLVGGYVTVFLAVLIAVTVLGMLVRAGLRMALLGGADRMLGGALGLVRGGFISAVLLLMATFTPLTAEPAWQQSYLRAALQPVVGWMDAQLPDVSWPMQNLERMVPKGLPSSLDGLVPAGLPLPSSGSSPFAESLLGKPTATGDNGVLGEVVAGRGWPRNVDPARGAASESANAPALPANIESAPERPDPAAVP